ncbi:hypothetical protein LZ32DRAFT_440579 [Colletotrichum eremochloae]|nr:hypothetical protein LZ32DRAFT_440579 [Colletotrichum eremochloae]
MTTWQSTKTVPIMSIHALHGTRPHEMHDGGAMTLWLSSCFFCIEKPYSSTEKKKKKRGYHDAGGLLRSVAQTSRHPIRPQSSVYHARASPPKCVTNPSVYDSPRNPRPVWLLLGVSGPPHPADQSPRSTGGEGGVWAEGGDVEHGTGSGVGVCICMLVCVCVCVCIQVDNAVSVLSISVVGCFGANLVCFPLQDGVREREVERRRCGALGKTSCLAHHHCQKRNKDDP